MTVGAPIACSRRVSLLLHPPSAPKVLSLLSGIAQSAYKMCGDLRLLANLKEIEEPFGKKQVRLYIYLSIYLPPRPLSALPC